MKHLKILGAAAVAAVALGVLIGAGNASAAGVFCSTQENLCGAANKWAGAINLDFTLKTGTTTAFTTTGGEVLDTCTASTLKSELLLNPNPNGEVTTENKVLNWQGCTFQTVTARKGKLKFTNIAGTFNGTVKVDEEIQVTINTVLFGSCVYGFPVETHLGELKEGKAGAATLVISAVASKASGSNAVCPETSRWTAEYTLTEPANTTLAVSPG